MLPVNQIAGFLYQLFLQNKTMKQSHFLHVDTNSQELKVYQNFFGWASVHSWLYLKNEQMELTEINWFFA